MSNATTEDFDKIWAHQQHQVTHDQWFFQQQQQQQQKLMMETTLSESMPILSSEYLDGYKNEGDARRHDDWFYRFLASYDETSKADRIDYSVLSVGVLTLGLILIVEVIRHRLQSSAKGRPFFRTVLEGVYTELATLGIVEFLLHLMTTYYKSYDKAKKEVFSDVHFLLFYTAILNAFQSCLVATVSRRRSQKMWVQTEALELNHYVEIREEFQVVENKLRQIKQPQIWGRKEARLAEMNNSNSLTKSHRNEGSPPKTYETSGTSSNNGAGQDISTNAATNRFVSSWIKSFSDQLRYPRLKHKYNQLLVQIRFHELRISFLQSYNLPLKLRVSDYLMRCELDVLIKLVHVSSMAWILLTSAANFLYYVLGIVTYQYGEPELVGLTLIWIFFSFVVLFIGLAYITSNKMKSVFNSMMKEKHLWDISNNDITAEEKERQLHNQVKMFWGSNPMLVISAIQFMQFSYALALSALIVFWDEISDGSVPMSAYVVAIFVCYFIFLFTIGEAIPQYTMCTSLAQLVNVKLLQESLASYHLEEAKRKEKLQISEFVRNPPSNDGGYNGKHDSSLNGPLLQQHNAALSISHEREGMEVDGQVGASTKVNGVDANMSVPIIPEQKSLSFPDVRMTHMNERILQTDAAIDPLLPSNPRKDNIELEKEKLPRIRSNGRRKKAVSEGITGMFVHDEDPNTSITSSFMSTPNQYQQNRITVEDFDVTNWTKGLQTIRDPVESNVEKDTATDLELPASLISTTTGRRRQRNTRQKSVSDGVALMAKLHATDDLMLSFHSETASDSKHPLKASQNTNFRIAKSFPSQYSVDSKSALVMAEMVRRDTSELRSFLPILERPELENPAAQHSGQIRSTRLKKNLSDGVSSMASGSDTSKHRILFGSHLSCAAESKLVDGSPPRGDLTSKFQRGTDQHQESMFTSSMPICDQQSRVHRSRRRTMKSISDGVAFMSKLHLIEPELTESPSSIVTGDTRIDTIESTKLQPSEVVDALKMCPPKASLAEVISDIGIMGVATRVANGKSTEDDASLISTEGYCSDDDDDVPHLDRATSERKLPVKKSREPLRDKLRRYFLSKKYVLLSNLFGTTVVFFIIAKRVEVFLHSEDIVSDDFVSFHFSIKGTFWVVFVWFSLFIAEAFVSFWAMSPLHSIRSTMEKKIITAAFLDVILTSFCLTLFLIGESRRCCKDENTRFLSKVENDIAAADTEVSEGYGSICDCPAFGSRSYGGLGVFEPFISLIALRLFRQYVAKRILGYFDKKEFTDKDATEAIQNHQPVVSPFSVFDENRHTHGDHGEDEEIVGTAAQLWEAAIVKHPDLVLKYGEFSGEILRAMLGLSPLEYGTETTVKTQMSCKNSVLLKTEPCPGNENEGLPPETVVELINVNNPIPNANSSKRVSFMPESNAFPDAVIQQAYDTNDAIELGIDHGQVQPKNLEVEVSFPDATLLRSMRRCDRKMLPMLDKWTVVDVVITRFEMVYFDVNCCDDDFVISGKQLLQSTKGGKSLRLRDVAAGRRIVGHLEFSDIQAVHVNRYMPSACVTGKDQGPDLVVESTEFWKPHSSTSTAHSKTRSADWDASKQDVLTIKTSHGRTVVLRFYSDLEEALHHPDRLADEDEMFGELFKNNALQWAQTIVRLCGPDQLHRQKLPHLGNETSDELRDYLVIHHDKSDHGKSFRHRRTNSVGLELARMESVRNMRSSSVDILARRPFLKRAQTQHNAPLATATVPKSSLKRSNTISGQPSVTRNTDFSPRNVTPCHRSMSFEDNHVQSSVPVPRPNIVTRSISLVNLRRHGKPIDDVNLRGDENPVVELPASDDVV